MFLIASNEAKCSSGGRVKSCVEAAVSVVMKPIAPWGRLKTPNKAHDDPILETCPLCNINTVGYGKTRRHLQSCLKKALKWQARGNTLPPGTDLDALYAYAYGEATPVKRKCQVPDDVMSKLVSDNDASDDDSDDDDNVQYRTPVNSAKKRKGTKHKTSSSKGPSSSVKKLRNNWSGWRLAKTAKCFDNFSEYAKRLGTTTTCTNTITI